MIQRNFARFSAIAFTILIAGCNGADTAAPSGSSSGSTPKQVANRSKFISDLVFKDSGLQLCVSEMVRDKGWKTVGEFTELRCYGLQKNRLNFFDSERTIRDLTGIEQLVALKNLSVPGHAYSSVDTRALTDLETLDLYEAFIHSLDVSHNTKLQSLNVGATAIKNLDLTGLKALKSLSVSYTSDGYHDFYTPTSISTYGGVYGIKLEEIQSLQKTIRFDQDIKLTHIDAGNNAIIDLPSGVDLVSAKAHLTARSLTAAAKNLSLLDVTLVGATNIDLSSSPLLSSVKIQLAEPASLTLGAGVTKLEFVGPVTNIQLPKNAQLNELILHGVKMPEHLNMPLPNTITQLKLKDADINSIDLASLDKLESLTLENVAATKLILPSNPLKLFLTDIKGIEPVIFNATSVKELYVENPSKLFCSQININFPAVENMQIYNCLTESIDLTGLKNLQSLSLSMPKLTSIDFAQAPALTSIQIHANALNDLDLSSFEGKNNGNIYFSSAQLPEAVANNIIADAKRLFWRWGLYINDLGIYGNKG